MDVDAETLRIAAEQHMNQSVCVICKKVTLFIVNERKTNIALTCGRSQCMEAAERWKPK